MTIRSIHRIWRRATVVLSVLLVCGCSLSTQPRTPYPPAEVLSQAPSLRQDFIQEFLQGRWATARSLFSRTEEYFLRRDNFCAVARTYILAYKLHAYLGINYPHLLDKANIFSQQGLDCGLLFDASGRPVKTTTDLDMDVLLADSQWRAIHDSLLSMDDPLFVSVYGRKAAQQAILSTEDGDGKWARIFIGQAHDVDSSRGWILFLIEDWKLSLALERNQERKHWIKKRIDTLYTLIGPCNQPIMPKTSP
ncbi:hypothetical protein [Desulfoplanes sp.]